MPRRGRFAKALGEGLRRPGSPSRAKLERRLGVASGYLTRWSQGALLPGVDSPGRVVLTALADALALDPAAMLDAAMRDHADRAGVLDYFERQTKLLQEPGLSEYEALLVSVLRTVEIDRVDPIVRLGIAELVAQREAAPEAHRLLRAIGRAGLGRRRMLGLLAQIAEALIDERSAT